MENNTLIGVTGITKQINIITIPGNQLLFTYNTMSSFNKGAIYFYEEQKNLILVDTTPIIYICNYLLRNITTFNTFIKDIQGILIDKNKNVIFFYSYQFIYALEFPNMKHIETFSLHQYNQNNILNIQINSILQVLIVQTSTAFISFDLTEILYIDEINLFQLYKVKNIKLNEEYSVYYSLQNLSLNLYKEAQLVNSLLFEPFQQNIYPYFTEPILIAENQFIYIAYNKLYVIQANLQLNILTEIFKINLSQTPDNYFYDSKSNNIFLLYSNSSSSKLYSVDISDQNKGEVFLTSFLDVDASKAQICSQYIILPSVNIIYSYDIKSSQTNKVLLPAYGNIKLFFKFQINQLSSEGINWWNIPFENYERLNTNDFLQEGQPTKNILILLEQDSNQMMLVIDLLQNKIVQYKILDTYKVINIVHDPYRTIIYIINNIGTTDIFSFQLEFITSIQNSCLKQATISYDMNFVYSICPNDLIIYNGINFEQQFSIINKGIKEAYSLINMNYNNHIIIVQKNKLCVLQLKQDNTYEIIYEFNKKNIAIHNFKLSNDVNNQIYAIILISNYEDITKIQLPLSENKLCSIQIQQQNRISENVYTKTQLDVLTQYLNAAQQKLSLIEIEFQDGQSIQQTDIQVQTINIEHMHLMSLTLFSQYQNKVYWNNQTAFSKQINNLKLKNMSLVVQNEIIISSQNQMQNFQMQKVLLILNASINLENLNKVYLQQLSISIQNSSQIKISNCNLVVIDQLLLDEVSTSGKFLFLLSNNTQVVINQVKIIDSTTSQMFLITNSQKVNITNIQIQSCSHLSYIFNIQQVDNLSIQNSFINQSSFSTIYQIQSTIISSVQILSVLNSTNITAVLIEKQEINTVQYLSQQLNLSSVKLFSSTDIIFPFEAKIVEIYDVTIDHLEVSKIIFNIQADKITINNINITNSIPSIQGFDCKLINIENFMDSSIKNINSKQNQIQILSIQQQQNGGQALIYQSKFIDFSNLSQTPLIILNSLYSIKIENVIVENVVNINNYHTSILVILDCKFVILASSQFKNNINFNGLGGVIHAAENEMIEITNSNFSFNQCKHQNGGAIYISNTISQGTLILNKSQLQENKSLFSSGGAIYIQNINIIMNGSEISFNKAQIGGGIYYEQVIPDFLIDISKGISNNNTLKDNIAFIYGQNYGSTLRKIFIDQEKIEVSKGALVDFQDENVVISQFKSGDQLSFKKIQLLDEENKPIQSINLNSDEFNQLSHDVQSIIQQIIISVTWNQQNNQIQCIGELQSKQFDNNGFSLNFKVIYKPLSSLILKITSNAFPQIKDSKGNIVFRAGSIEQGIKVSFDQCSLGEIQKQYGNSIACEQCPDGKYSLNKEDQECKLCPDSAIKCIGFSIFLKNGYWRENENTDNILHCSFNPESCKPQLSTSKFNCDIGYKGPLCQSCDIYGEVWGNSYSEILDPGFCYKCDESTQKIIFYNIAIFFLTSLYILIILKRIIYQLEVKLTGFFLNQMDIIYLGSTLSQSDRSQIISKILTDHLQILTLVCTFTVSMPSIVTVPIQFSGDSVGMASKSIDCIFSNYSRLQPLWLFQSLWSLILPIGISFQFLLMGIIFMFFKTFIFIRYLRTAAIFIYFYFFPMIITLAARSMNCITIGDKSYLDLDLSIECYDKTRHLPFIFYFSIPLLIIWGVLIPLLLFCKINKVNQQKKSKFIQIKYSFLFAGYKEKFYYWEFWKLLYKVKLILISTILKQNIYLKVKFYFFILKFMYCSRKYILVYQKLIQKNFQKQQVGFMNLVQLFYFSKLYKSQPFIRKYFNDLQQTSIQLCTLSLNLCFIQVVGYKNILIFQLIQIFLVAAINFFFIFILVIGLSRLTISQEENKRNFIQRLIIQIKKKFPQLLDAQIQNRNNMRYLLKLKNVKKKIKLLVKYLKNYDFYSQISLQSHFNLSSRLQDGNQSQKFSDRNLLFSTETADEKQQIFQKKNFDQKIKNKWSYYTRNAKKNQTFILKIKLALKGWIGSNQTSLESSSYKADQILESNHSIQNTNKFQIQLSPQKN